MLHELLLAMAGEPTALQFGDCLEPSERAAFTRLADLGVIVAELNRVSLQNCSQGFYLYTLYSCIQTALDKYKKTLIDLEDRILNPMDLTSSGPGTPLSFILTIFTEVMPKFLYSHPDPKVFWYPTRSPVISSGDFGNWQDRNTVVWFGRKAAYARNPVSRRYIRKYQDFITPGFRQSDPDLVPKRLARSSQWILHLRGLV